MERLTERKNGVFVYAGPDRFDFDGAASPAQIAIRNAQTILDRLAAYEDIGLTPDEVSELAKIVRCKDCKHHVYYCNEDRKHWCYRRTDCFPVDENSFCSFGEMKGE